MEDDSLMFMSNLGLMERVGLNEAGGKCQLEEKKCLMEVKIVEE